MSEAGKQQERCPTCGSDDRDYKIWLRDMPDPICHNSWHVATPPEAATPGSLTRPAVHVTASPKPSIEEIAKNLRVRGGTLEDFKKACEVAPEAATLNAALDNARTHVMTDEEKEAQRQSWVRGEQAMGEGVAPEAAKPTSLKTAEDALISLSNMDNPPVMRQIAKGALARMKDAASPSPAAPKCACGHTSEQHERPDPLYRSCEAQGCDCSSYRAAAPQGEPQPEQRIQELERVLRDIKAELAEAPMGYGCIDRVRDRIEAVLKQSGGRG